MVSGSTDGRTGEGIENEAEREREMGMAHLAAAGPTSDSQRGHRLPACPRDTPLPARSQMAAAVYNNVLLIGPKRSSVVWRAGERTAASR